MRRTYFILALIILLSVIFRFFRLDKVPSGLIPEEASTAWNAYSLSQTGRDEWGNLIPVVFTETGGFKLALNSYLMVPVVKIFGLNEFSARFPTAFAGVLAVILTYFLTVELLKRKDIALSAAFLLSISPWHISMSRYGVDVNWGIPLFMLGFLFFIKARDKIWYLVLSGIFFALTYYTYFNYVIFTFTFIGILFILNWKLLIRRQVIKFLLIFVITQIIFLTPYITQKNLLTRFSQATSVGTVGFVNRINEHRKSCGEYSPKIFCQLIYNKPLERTIEFGKNLINHYSTTTFFLYGSQLGLSGMPQGWGFFHLFEFPLILIGIAVMIRKRLFSPILLFWGLIYGMPSSLAGEAHIWRMMTLIPLPQIIGAVGLIYLFNFWKTGIIRICIILVITFSIMRFTLDYFTFFPYYQGSYSYYGFADLYHYLNKIENDYDNIVIAPIGMNFNQLYIYYLFYSQFDPHIYQLGRDLDRSIGEQNWVWVDRIGKWYFVSEPQKVKYPLSEKTLLITDNIKPDDLIYDKILRPSLLHTIYHANGDIAFKIFNLR